MTKAAEFFELDDDELQNRIASSRRELLNLRFQLATGQLDNTQRLGDVRRNIARALTVLRARDLYEEEVELEPLVLTPARRIPIDETGGIDAAAEVEPDEDAEPESGDHEPDLDESLEEDTAAEAGDETEEDQDGDS
jgi:large subunit ribosomal protein L29